MDRTSRTLSQMDEASEIIDSFLKTRTYRVQTAKGEIAEVDIRPIEALQLVTALEKVYKMHVDLEKRIKGEGRYITAQQFSLWLDGMQELLILHVPARKREEASAWLHGLLERVFETSNQEAIPGEVHQDQGQGPTDNSIPALPYPREIPGGTEGE